MLAYSKRVFWTAGEERVTLWLSEMLCKINNGKQSSLWDHIVRSVSPMLIDLPDSPMPRIFLFLSCWGVSRKDSGWVSCLERRGLGSFHSQTFFCSLWTHHPNQAGEGDSPQQLELLPLCAAKNNLPKQYLCLVFLLKNLNVLETTYSYLRSKIVYVTACN